MEAGFKQPTHRYDKDGKLVLRSEYGKTGQGTFDTTLTTAVQAQQNWPTPNANPEWPNEGNIRLYRHQVINGVLTEQEATLMLRGKSPFEAQGKIPQTNWPTPTATERSGINPETGTGAGLSKTAQNWPTPTANEDAAGTPQGNMQKMLGNHPDVRSQDSGALAPDWVEWLMGLPIGWSKLEALPPTAYDQWFDQNNSWWDEERGLPRVGVGIKNRIKRLKALGNGLVPACVPEFLRQIRS
jgi:hypothetical protein